MLQRGGGGGDREIVFRLRLTPDERSQADLKNFGRTIEKIQQDAAESSAKAFQTATDRAMERQKRSEERANKDRIREAEKARKEQVRIAKEQADEEDRIHHRMRERQLDRARRNRKEREDEAKEAARLIKAQEAEAIRAARAQEAEEQRIINRRRQRMVNEARESRRELETRFRSARMEGASDAINLTGRRVQVGEAQAQTAGKIREYQNQIKESVNSSTDAVYRLARGLAYLSISGEKDSQKLLESLLKIEGAIQGVSAVGQLFGSAGGAVSAARKQAEVMNRQKSLRLLASSGSGLDFKSSGMSRMGWNAAMAGGVPAAGMGLGGAPLGLWGAAVGSTALASFSARSTIDQAMKYGIGRGADPDSFVDKIGQGVARGAGYLNFIPEVQRFNRMAGFDGLGDRELSRLENRTTSDLTMRSRASSQQAIALKAITDRNQEQSSLLAVRSGIDRNAPRLRSESFLAGQDLLQSTSRLGQLADPRQFTQEAFRAALSEAESARVRVSQTREQSALSPLQNQKSLLMDQVAANDSSLREARRVAPDSQEVLALEKQRFDLIRQHREVELQIKQVKSESARESLSSSREELRLRERMINEETGRITSAKERFAMLRPHEQQQIIATQRQLSKADELRNAGRTEEADRLTKDIRNEDLMALRGLGLGKGERQVSGELVRRAEESFPEFAKQFAADEVARIEEFKAQKNKLEATIKAQHEIVVRNDFDEQALVQAISDEVRKNTEFIRNEVIKRIEETRAAETARINNNNHANRAALLNTQK